MVFLLCSTSIVKLYTNLVPMATVKKITIGLTMTEPDLRINPIAMGYNHGTAFTSRSNGNIIILQLDQSE